MSTSTIEKPKAASVPAIGKLAKKVAKHFGKCEICKPLEKMRRQDMVPAEQNADTPTHNLRLRTRCKKGEKITKRLEQAIAWHFGSP